MDDASPLTFKQSAARALADAKLQRALQNVKRGFIIKGANAKAKLPEFNQLRDEARALKDHTLLHLDLYLEAYERKVIESGAQVHFAPSAADARDIVLKICKDAGAPLVTKGKSMVSEEIGLNAHLEAAGIEVAETDLGEHIIQIRHDAPSHIVAPVIHLNKEEIAEDFIRAHPGLPRDRSLSAVPDLVAEAPRRAAREVCSADVGITEQPAHRRDRILGDRHQ